MKYQLPVITLLLMIPLHMFAQSLSPSYTGTAIGTSMNSANTGFDKNKQVYTLRGAGQNIWFDKDEFWFEHTEITGDFIFSAQVEFIGKGTNAHRKIGLMARKTLNPNSEYVDICVHGDGLTAMQFREKEGANTGEIQSKVVAPEFIQLERKGNEFLVRVSKDNEPLVTVAKKTMNLDDEIYLGMFICSHDSDTYESATFSNVRIDVPEPEGRDGYQNPSPSRMEILDIESGLRKVIYTTSSHIEAPNWSRDGKYLIYNSDGLLYRLNLEGVDPIPINTGFARANNNDHGISFDGKTLAISSATDVDGKRQSIIYTVPVDGGTPRRVTSKGPSYWHGWSPDDKWLTYCAERNGNYDVYKIPVEGGNEIRLTTTEGLDDGPEYSSDGRYIYFNSVRSGSMEIWRMQPDGTEQEQVTDDIFQNWFAHPSPDGKWLIMVSYLPEVPAGSHPRNKRVMLRLLNLEDKSIKNVAFLYGGQGTINVPSWSPDSKKVAFVSYTY